MAAICGWVDDQRDLTRAPAAITAMAAGLAPRAQGQVSSWSDPRAVFVHRADPAEAGQLQVATPTGHPGVVVMLDGVLGRPLRLARELSSRGLAAADASPADLLGAGYLAWGERVAEHLDGAYAFAIWDRRRRRLLLGRDRFGTKPLYFVGLPTGLLFASQVAALTDHPVVVAELDAPGLCEVLTQLRRPGHAGLRDLREVLPAHVATYQDRTLRQRRYWSLPAVPHHHDRAATIAHAQEHLVAALARQGGEGTDTVLLSGGLDSSTLAALAAAEAARPPRTYTVAVARGVRAIADAPFARTVADHIQARHREVLVAADALTDPQVRATALAAKDFPTPFGDKNITPYLLYRVVARDSPTALSGEGADTVFGALAAFDPEREPQSELETFPWIVQARRFGSRYGLGNGLLDPGLLQRIGLREFCAERYQEARAEVPQLADAPVADRQQRELSYLVLTHLMEQGVQHSERLASAAGLQIRYPFLDHQLLTYLYNVPSHIKLFDGREKSLLRAIAGPLLPPEILARPKVPFPVTYDQAYQQWLAGELAGVLADGRAPVGPLLDRVAAAQIVADPRRLDRGGWLSRADVEMVLQLDSWLRRLAVRLAL